ncbi:squamosa promoter binding-like protein [Striga asiatica]|uniref:Squamosa promoter binding-like protein n=1 Tax=Striga asiatica TaxID=4170 RepID=A0A5A7QE09_STRAF|nr:squamosa promoter binding-like protein [Striga asiatica]
MPMKEKVMNSKNMNNFAEQEDNFDGLSGGGGKRCSGGDAGSSVKKCQVERCLTDPNEAKIYHQRHRVCELHAKAQVVPRWWSPESGRGSASNAAGFFLFHELSEFDEAKRSCRRRLAGHNERRRKNFSDENNISRATKGSATKKMQITKSFIL